MGPTSPLSAHRSLQGTAEPWLNWPGRKLPSRRLPFLEKVNSRTPSARPADQTQERPPPGNRSEMTDAFLLRGWPALCATALMTTAGVERRSVTVPGSNKITWRDVCANEPKDECLPVNVALPHISQRCGSEAGQVGMQTGTEYGEHVRDASGVPGSSCDPHSALNEGASITVFSLRLSFWWMAVLGLILYPKSLICKLSD